MTVAIGETFSQAVLVISRTAKPSRKLFWTFRQWRQHFYSSRKLTFRNRKAKIIKNND
jgi:hypothetical protein